jgi:hypothetical protein
LTRVGDCSRPRHALPMGEEHSCSPSQGMSMLVPDFAAVRYFFNYRFPHVFHRFITAAASEIRRNKKGHNRRAIYSI